MTPQSNFMVAAPLLAEREAGLRALLAEMNLVPGAVDANNAIFPFARFGRLHVARFVILADNTTADAPSLPSVVWFAFLGDCDGDADSMLAEFAAQAGDGLRRLFGHCAGFPGNADLLAWMRAHRVQPEAQYVNWVGRTVPQIHEEAALQAALRARLAQQATIFASMAPAAIRESLIAWHAGHGPTLTAPSPTPLGWALRLWLNRIGVPLVLLLLSPALLIGAPFFLWYLRRRETTDAVIAPRPPLAHVTALSAIEDHDVTNPFSAIGSVKPGRFRLYALLAIFQLLDFSTRQFYTRGRLARVGTIHFARWVFLDDRRRVFFASNYDGSLDSYMDDFINKVAFGLNLVFSNGLGYPHTDYLLCGGAKNEGQFKNYLRRHAVPTQVWYKAYPGLTAADLARNTLIREGLQAGAMTDAAARTWLASI